MVEVGGWVEVVRFWWLRRGWRGVWFGGAAMEVEVVGKKKKRLEREGTVLGREKEEGC
ncbi:uncharacterized protein G2W53_003557 [Senna tora]|uniref:Uncharacterized protein n=1 Tax=Senna tora TaxID=362788 RepID=A0A835CGI6_9FABA|nr:uncharacterized protein G2W53_003557 [Senna tora]